MRMPVLVLVVALVLVGSGLGWFALRRSRAEPAPSVSPDLIQRSAEPQRPPVELARPAPAARV
jgi:Flp pilus assembly protein CpaB